jgi:hypothetical protein
MKKLFTIQIFILFLFSQVVVSQSNYSLLFDGQNDYVEFPFAAHHDLFGDFSIELWIKFDSIPDGRILSKVIWDNPLDTISSYSIYFDKNIPYKVIFSTLVSEFPYIEHKLFSLLPVIYDQWNYIVVTYLEATYTKKIYINGILSNEEDNTGNLLYNGRPLIIGAFKKNQGDIILPFKGNMDEVRIWQKTLTESEIIYNMNNSVIGNEDDLVGLWHFNEGVGDTIYDSSYYGVNGSVSGANWDNGFTNSGVYIHTTLTSNASSGSQILEVANSSNFLIGDNIIINLGGENEEQNSITGFGSILLQTPLQFEHFAEELVIKFSPTSVEENYNFPEDYYLFQNYPNPFNPFTKIKFSVPSTEIVQIKVYDILGKEIRALLNEYRQAGTYEVEFDASNLTSGIYFYRIISGSYSETKKMILLR